MTLAPVSQVVRKRQGWAQAMGALQEIFQKDGMEAEKRAADLATLYEGARALAVIDVVASRQRPYRTGCCQWLTRTGTHETTTAFANSETEAPTTSSS